MRIPPKKKYPWYLRWLFRYEKRRYGQALLPAKIWGRSPRLLLSFASLIKALNRKKSPLDPQLRALISVHIAELLNCPFCLDINNAMLKKRGGKPTLTPAHNAALAYAESMVVTRVTDEQFANLKEHFTDDQIVELTGLIATQIASSKFNTALDIPSQQLKIK